MSDPLKHPPLRVVLAVYKRTLSPILATLTGGGCRYSPTCSEYAVEAVEQHGFFSGCWLALKRICRCHPWGGLGYDPVPPGKNQNPAHSAECADRQSLKPLS